MFSILTQTLEIYICFAYQFATRYLITSSKKTQKSYTMLHQNVSVSNTSEKLLTDYTLAPSSRLLKKNRQTQPSEYNSVLNKKTRDRMCGDMLQAK